MEIVDPIAINPSSDEAFDHPLTISELLNIALKNHPSTQRAWWNANRAAFALENAKSSYYPKVSLNTDFKNGRDFKFINGPNTSYTIFGADLFLSMILYDFGERDANVNMAKMSLLSANWIAEWNIQHVMVNVLENTYALLHLQEVLKAAYSSLLDAEKMFRAASDLNRIGMTPISDVYSAQATLSQMKIELSRQQSLLDIQKGKLAIALGVSANAPIEVASLGQIEPPPKQDVDQLIVLASQYRGDLVAKRAKVSESFANYNKTRASYRPRVSFQANGGANHAVHDNTSGLQYQIGLNLEIPLFDGFESTYATRMAYADTRLSIEELAELQLKISLEVLSYSRSLTAAQEMLPEAEENLKNSMKAYESILEAYLGGKVRIIEISNAHRQLAMARVLYSDVKTQWLVSMANLAFATGTLSSNLER